MGTGLPSLIQVVVRGPDRARQIPVTVAIDNEAAITGHAGERLNHGSQLMVDIGG
jgi:hypothetical protein